MKPNLRDLINILALPNMGDEGRKAKLIAIKAWQIQFQDELHQSLTWLETQWHPRKDVEKAKRQADIDRIKQILGEE